MRTPIALAICVSLLCTLSLAADTAEWTTVYQAGLAASQRHSDDEALGLFQRNWETSGTPLERGLAASAIGLTCSRLSRTNEAIKWLERARQSFAASPLQVSKLAATAADLADLYRTANDYAAAERLLREVIAVPALDAELRGLLRNNLADLMREEGRSAEARPLFEESIASRAASPRQRLGALIGLADIDRQTGHWTESIDRWNEALEICRAQRDEKTEAIALRGLGITWLRSGAPGRAEPLLRRSLHIMENNADMPPEEVAGAHSSLAELYRSENKLALAEDEWSRALQIDRNVLGAATGDAHPQIAVLMEMLSGVYSMRGELGLARQYATRASEIMSSSFGENSMPVATALTWRADVEQRAGDPAAAANDYERAIRIARSHPEHRSLQLAMIRSYAGLLKTMHRPREAKALLTSFQESSAPLP